MKLKFQRGEEKQNKLRYELLFLLMNSSCSTQSPATNLCFTLSEAKSFIYGSWHQLNRNNTILWKRRQCGMICMHTQHILILMHLCSHI